MSFLGKQGQKRSAPPAEEPPKPKKKPEPQAVVYKPPPKRRTTPKVAQLRKQLRPKLLATPDEADTWDSQNPEHQQTIRDRLKMVLQRANITLTPPELQELEQMLMFDLLGFAAIEPMVRDKTYTEIMVNGPEIIFGERKGRLKETEFVFDDEEHIQWMAQRIVRPLQRDISRRNPMVDARLPDGSRVHLIMPPSALQGTTVTIRKFPDERLTAPDLISFGSFTEEVSEFLDACVKVKLNVVVSGGTGSGKTTLLNVLSSFIPEDERIVTIEDSAELNLAQRHVVGLETCPPLPGTSEGQLVIRDLVKGSLRMRPDRIVVGECRSGEALDMLQAMNTGHDGSLTTLHANGPREAIRRLETMCLMAGVDMPLNVIRNQIATAVHLFVQQSRLQDGSRKITQITEVQGMEGESVTMMDLFVYKLPGQTTQGPSHSGGGILEATGFRPKFYPRFEEMGIKLSPAVFGTDKMQFSKK
ncbi:CpaF family protein [Chloroflexota bacterium]